ncbi:MAG: hypothetical protein JWR26_1582 [Pedosphaera sp.]|nr:hypothetical protein [Pedosphaera sp.]
MNDHELKKLFGLARHETPPVAPAGFDARVVSALRREQRVAPLSLWDQLEQLFPRLAIASVLAISLCIMADFGLSSLDHSSLSADVGQISEQWLFGADEN